MFKLLSRDVATLARTTSLETPHGTIKTPVFMPVGTAATVKAVPVEYLHQINTEIILSNTYHLYLQPGTEVMKAAGGLHRFMNWDRPILTDSGGFQAYSLSRIKKIQENGIEFQSFKDGSKHFFSPQKVIEIQEILGSDIMMPLDICTPFGTKGDELRDYTNKTIQWAKLSKEYKNHSSPQLLFGIVQGGNDPQMRLDCLKALQDIQFPGYAIGSLSVGEPDETYYMILEAITKHMSETPVYVMGVGDPEKIVRSIALGVDMFDCVLPTRIARNRSLFTNQGRITISNARFEKDFTPIDEECKCPTCQHYSRAYLRHLYKSGEILASILGSVHNLFFLIHLVERARIAIEENRYKDFANQFLNEYCQGESDADS